MLLLPGIHLFAQSVKVVECTKQDWAGGVAGKRGTHYNITFSYPTKKKDIILDTIWVGQRKFQIFMPQSPSSNVVVTKKGKLTMAAMRLQVSYDEVQYPNVGNESASKAPIKNYKGVALLQYHEGNKKNELVIPKVTHTFDQVNYP